MLLLIIFVMVGVAFFTLLERKVLGYIQIRKGPNKVGYMGLLQPFSDALKLFSKESIIPLMSNYLIYYFSPIFNFFLSLSLWLSLPYLSIFFSFNFSFLFFLCVSSLSVYSLMLSGWSSNSIYSLLGSLRSIAQTISYEVSLALLFISLLFMILSFNFYSLIIYQKNIWFIFFMLGLMLMVVVSSLAETNRSPFDFAEGESELVSGFNVEYSSGGFALIFLSEYSSIIFMSFLISLMFLGGNLLSFVFFILVGFLCFFWLWVRGTLPRFRYDKLMYLAWKSYLPLSLFFILFYLSLKFYILILNI
uniref:NADH-ubiquinone oxidoreductase chain 1 n=1 Tax=Ptiliidae sp. BMNH 1274726 TaxID=1796538 RepID=A0A126TGE5_9COLE|nr:NADH dehydrogenase subunit 1 [Ptiliidae sp. BMNH 1274726]